MKTHAFSLGLATAALLALGGCTKQNKTANGAPKAQTEKAQKVAGTKTIAALAGPGPYTVFVPDDAAFNSAPAGTFDAKPQNRTQLTGVITNLILQGTVMAADIDKSIDHGKGKALLATMGGGILTATRDGGKTVLTDGTGHKATITQADETYTNGVVHHIDALLMPSKAVNGPAVGQKVGKR